MTKKLLAICLAVVSFAGLFQATASASEVVVSTQPAVVRINQAVVIETGRRHRYYRHHRYYRRHGYYRHHRYHRDGYYR